MANANPTPARAPRQDVVRFYLDTRSVESYRLFLKVKALPRFSFCGREAVVPREYLALLGLPEAPTPDGKYRPKSFLFDYQRDIARLAIRKRKFAVFAQCGLGKCLISLEFARHCAAVLPPGQCVLLVMPLMVVRQTMREAERFYGKSLPLEQVRAADLPAWLASRGAGAGRIGVTNYEAITGKVKAGRLGSLVLDESSLLKSHYGKWGARLIELGRGLHWKLCLTGTPAPNDRIEFANHAVFLDQFPTVNSFLARYFVNRGETNERWELKAHALKPFYRSLSHWCLFLESPATYGWKDNVATIPPIIVTIHDVALTEAQKELVVRAGGDMYGTPGGITSRAKLAQLAKGRHEGADVATHKPAFVRNLVDGWPEESTLIWCRFNEEQKSIERAFPGAASIAGDTPEAKRLELIEDFQAGRRKILISKPKVLGFGLNLQIATRQVFSTLQDSWEEFHQAVKRSNRIGSIRPLNVHVPVTEIERAMVDTVLRKAHRVEEDAREQERIFKESARVAF